MKKQVHRSKERGKSDLGWLHSRFSFSFADYYNPKRTGFGKLLVFNDDTIKPGKGFGLHPHKNMEIITLVTEGELAHKDSTGAEEVLKPGEVQVMSAGSGIAHSEYNLSFIHTLKLFQIWIETKEKNIKPRHDKKWCMFSKNTLQLIVSGTKGSDSLYIHQKAKMYLGKFEGGKEIKYQIGNGKGVFIFVIEGTLNVKGTILKMRDSIEMSEADHITLKTVHASYFMIIEVPMK